MITAIAPKLRIHTFLGNTACSHTTIYNHILQPWLIQAQGWYYFKCNGPNIFCCGMVNHILSHGSVDLEPRIKALDSCQRLYHHKFTNCKTGIQTKVPVISKYKMYTSPCPPKNNKRHLTKRKQDIFLPKFSTFTPSPPVPNSPCCGMLWLDCAWPWSGMRAPSTTISNWYSPSIYTPNMIINSHM